MCRPRNVGKPHRLLARGLKVAPEFDQLGAERAHGGVLLARIALRREDRHLEAGAPPGEGETLPDDCRASPK